MIDPCDLDYQAIIAGLSYSMPRNSTYYYLFRLIEILSDINKVDLVLSPSISKAEYSARHKYITEVQIILDDLGWSTRTGSYEQ